MTKNYIVLCEMLWRGWLAHSSPRHPLTVSGPVCKQFKFDRRAAPEPYISFLYPRWLASSPIQNVTKRASRILFSTNQPVELAGNFTHDVGS